MQSWGKWTREDEKLFLLFVTDKPQVIHIHIQYTEITKCCCCCLIYSFGKYFLSTYYVPRNIVGVCFLNLATLY